MSKIYASTDNEDYLRVLRHFRKPGSMLAALLENLSDGICARTKYSAKTCAIWKIRA